MVTPPGRSDRSRVTASGRAVRQGDADGPFLGQRSGLREQGRWDAEDPAWCRGPGQVPGGKDPSVVDGLDAGGADEGVGPEQETVACRGRVAGAQDLGSDPAQWRVGDQRDAGARGLAGAQPLPDLGGDVPAVECGDVGGVDRMQQVADGEDAGCAGAQGAVHAGPAVAGSRSRPAERASSLSPIQSPVVMTVSQRTVRRAPLSRFWISTDSTRDLPLIRVTRVRVATGTPRARRPAARTAA